MAFHLDRLQSIRKTKGRGARSDGWGSETIPLLREITAIPRSMEQLNLEMGERYGEREKKEPFCITSSYPEGRHPQMMAEWFTREGRPCLACFARNDGVTGSNPEWSWDQLHESDRHRGSVRRSH